MTICRKVRPINRSYLFLWESFSVGFTHVYCLASLRDGHPATANTHIYTQNRHQTVGDFWESSQPDAGYELIFTNKSRILLLYRAKLLHVDRFHHLLAVGYRGLLEGLAATELFNDASLFKFTLEFLQSAFDVLAFFYLYDNHCAVNLLDFCSVV